MKKISDKVKIAILMIFVFSVFLTNTAFPASASSIIETEAKYGVPEAIDGILDKGWDGTKVNVNECTFVNQSMATDIGVSWRVMYDNVYLYFFVEVVDSTIGDDKFEFDSWGNYYAKNSIHMMFDLGYERVNYYDSNDFYIDVSCRGYIHERGLGTTDNIKYAVVTDEDGYNVELRFDHSAYSGFKAKKGTKIGFDLWGNDCIPPTSDRKYCITWADETGESYRNASRMGTIVLGEIPEGVTPTVKEVIDKERYPGITNETAEQFLKGTELRSKGATFKAITNLVNPKGGGNKDISVIVDGRSGKSDSEQYDSYQAEFTDKNDPWFGLIFSGDQYVVTSVVFWEGGQWGNGGWFGDAPKVQLLMNSEWYDCEQIMTPDYPDDDATAHLPSFQPYIFSLSKPVLCEGVRVIGPKNQFGQNTSCSEIEVFGYKADADIDYLTLDGKSSVIPGTTDDPALTGENTTEIGGPVTDVPITDQSGKNNAGNEKTTNHGKFDFVWWIVAAVIVAAGAVTGFLLGSKRKK